MLPSENTAWVENGNGNPHIEQYVEVDMAAEIDSLNEILYEKYSVKSDREKWMVDQFVIFLSEKIELETEKAHARVIKQVVALLINAKNAKLQSYGLAFASGLEHLAGLTMTDAAKRLHVTKAAVSKVTVKACEFLGLNRSRYMKTEKAAEAYRVRAIEVHRRNGH